MILHLHISQTKVPFILSVNKNYKYFQESPLYLCFRHDTTLIYFINVYINIIGRIQSFNVYPATILCYAIVCVVIDMQWHLYAMLWDLFALLWEIKSKGLIIWFAMLYAINNLRIQKTEKKRSRILRKRTLPLICKVNVLQNETLKIKCS